MNAHTVVITIGRNKGGWPMDSEEWATFQDEIENELIHVSATGDERNIIGRFQGVGIWEGSHELSAAFMAFVPADAMDELRRNLASLAHHYGQDGIGLVVHADTESVVTA